MANRECRPAEAVVYPIALGQMAFFDGYCLKSGKDRLWIDLPASKMVAFESGEAERVFYTHVPPMWDVPHEKAEVMLGEKELKIVEKQRSYQQRVFQSEGYPQGVTLPLEYNVSDWPDNAKFIASMRDGEQFNVGESTVQCIHTPGPTPGHTCLYLPEDRILFTGILLSHPPKVGVWDGSPCGLEELFGSLERIKDIPAHRVFPEWKEQETLQSRVDAVTRHCYFRMLELLRLVQDYSGLTAYELAGKFSHQEAAWGNLHPAQKWDAMEETLAYLIYLREQDYVSAQKENGHQINFPGPRHLTDA